MPYTDYTKPSGSPGYLLIRDYGTYVEFWIVCTDPATSVGSLAWGSNVDGVGGGGFTSFSAGQVNKLVATVYPSYSQTVTFSIGASGTVGIGGPTTFNQYISRATIPPAPSQPTYNSLTNTSVQIQFNGTGDGGSPILEWQLRRSTTAGFVPGTLTDYVSSGTTNISDLIPDEDTWWAARGRNALGWGPFSTILGPVHAHDVPEKPITPNATSITSLSFGINTTDPDSNGAAISGRQTVISLFSNFSSLVATKTTVDPTFNSGDGVQRSKRYYSRFRVQNTYGYSPWSDSITVDTPGAPPSAPAGYIVYDVASTSCVVSLGSIADNGGGAPSKVRVKISTTNSDAGLVQTVVGDEWLPLPIYGLTEGVNYYAAEAAFNTITGGGWGPYGSWEPFTMRTDVPIHPGSVTIDDIFDTEATVDWTLPADLNGSSLVNYVVRIARNKQMTTALTSINVSTAVTEKNVEDLTAGLTYWAEVFSMSSNGKGSAAAPVSFLTTGGVAPEQGLWMNVPGVGLRHGKLWANVPGVGIREGSLWANVPGVGIREGV